VTKNIILTPDALTERYTAADPASDEDLARAVALASAGLPGVAAPAADQPGE
jgi:hypothetical protein